MARRFGYSRVSTSDQDWSLQLQALTKAGVDDRDIFRDSVGCATTPFGSSRSYASHSGCSASYGPRAYQYSPKPPIALESRTQGTLDPVGRPMCRLPGTPQTVAGQAVPVGLRDRLCRLVWDWRQAPGIRAGAGCMLFSHRSPSLTEWSERTERVATTAR